MPGVLRLDTRSDHTAHRQRRTDAFKRIIAWNLSCTTENFHVKQILLDLGEHFTTTININRSLKSRLIQSIFAHSKVFFALMAANKELITTFLEKLNELQTRSGFRADVDPTLRILMERERKSIQSMIEIMRPYANKSGFKSIAFYSLWMDAMQFSHQSQELKEVVLGAPWRLQKAVNVASSTSPNSWLMANFEHYKPADAVPSGSGAKVKQEKNTRNKNGSARSHSNHRSNTNHSQNQPQFGQQRRRNSMDARSVVQNALMKLNLAVDTGYCVFFGEDGTCPHRDCKYKHTCQLCNQRHATTRCSKLNATQTQ